MSRPVLPPFAPIFPLPEVVFFPGVVMPLHIFEPRYRAMTADALGEEAGAPGTQVADMLATAPAEGASANAPRGGRLIVLTLLRAGWEEAYEGTPPVHAIATAGEIADSRRLDDGRYFLTLRGLQRVRLTGEELMADGGYRLARVVSAPETPGRLETLSAADELMQLLNDFSEWNSSVQVMADPKLLVELPERRAVLLNTLAFHLSIPPARRQELLDESDLGERLSRVQEIVRNGLGGKRAMSAFRHVAPDNPRMN